MIIIGGQKIDYRTAYKISSGATTARLSSSVRKKLQKVRDALDQAVKDKKIMYGITTGFGAFKNKAISQDQVKELQENLIFSHAVGVGEPFPEKIVRAIMFIIANYLSKGHSGVRLIVIDTLLEMLNKGVIPVVPEKGSVGSSGDLAPSAHIILVLIGKGEAFYKEKLMPGELVMKRAGIKPIQLEAKEGLALINNTATMTANAVFALSEAKKLADLADITGALSAEALRATTKAFDKDVHKIKPHKGQMIVAERLRRLLTESTMIDDTKIQDQYSIRCMPQVHGAVREVISFVEQIVDTELNSVTDNPLLFLNEKQELKVVSGGNFHGEAIALAMDALGMAVSELGNISDRRCASLVDPATNNGLPAFLTPQGGVNSGMMILQYTTAALASENKILAHPASVDSIPTSANVEDFVSMGTIAARKAVEITENVKKILAIELLIASQAVDFRIKEGYSLGKMTKRVYEKIRSQVPFFKKDAIYYPYIEKLASLIDNYEDK